MILVRHGATEWSKAWRLTGRTDLPLIAEGDDEARGLASRLREHAGATVWVSPLQRARRTCELAGFADRAEVVDDLIEWDFGEYEGGSTMEIRTHRPGWSVWSHDCPGGESIDAVTARAERVIARARALDADVLCFAHGLLLRLVAARWLGAEPTLGRQLVMGPASVSVVGWERETPAIVRWNA